MSPATRYRRLRSRQWVEPKFQALDDSTKVVALYLATGPQTNAVGLYRLSPGSAVEDLGVVSVRQFLRRLEIVLRAFGWRHEPSSGLLWIPEWAEENTPQNPNVVKSWRGAFNELPESALKAEAVGATFDFLKSKGKAFAEAFGDPFPESVAESFRNRSPNTPDPVPDWPNRCGKDERRLANAASTRAIVDELQRRRGLA